MMSDEASNQEPAAPEPGEEEAQAAEPAAESVEQTVEQLRQEADEHWNKYLRVVADLENLRKRSARELENARKFGAERLAQELLPVRDSIEAALTSADSADVETLIEGDRATLRLLDQALESVGVREIDPHAEPFDPNKHEAIGMLESDRVEPDSVIEVVQKGYEIHERVMRPARVLVAKEPGA